MVIAASIPEKAVKQRDPSSGFTDDPRWLLIDRIVSSPVLSKSPKLCTFLSFICERTLDGRDDDLNEQLIGQEVFGRSPDYDASADSIVRSHATRLRQKLEQYFESAEGMCESLIVEVPKGAYVPVFRERCSEDSGSSPAVHEEPAIEMIGGAPAHVRTSIGKLILCGGISVILLASAFALGRLSRIDPLQREEKAFPLVASFWASLFPANKQTLIVPCDSGLVLLQGFTQHRVTLAEYLDGRYRSEFPDPQGVSRPIAALVASRRDTTMVDLKVAVGLLRMNSSHAANSEVRYARDVRPDDLKEHNAILLGNMEASPWIELFESSMNFVFKNDLAHHIFTLVNRSPQGSEHAQYTSAMSDPNHVVYGVVAYLPSVSGTGNILLLEGASRAGTECASDFVFDRPRFESFLRQIRRGDGSIPHFEVLLEAHNMEQDASQSSVIGYRIHQN